MGHIEDSAFSQGSWQLQEARALPAEILTSQQKPQKP